MSSTDRADRLKRAAIYREAARMIESRRESFTCLAIMEAASDLPRGDSIVSDYVRTFTRGDQDDLQTRFGFVAYDGENEGRALRILALCFMAAIAEAGDV